MGATGGEDTKASLGQMQYRELLLWLDFSVCLLWTCSVQSPSLDTIAAEVKSRAFPRLPGNPCSTEHPHVQKPAHLEFPKCQAITDTSSKGRVKQTREKRCSGPPSHLQTHEGEGLSLPSSEKFNSGKTPVLESGVHLHAHCGN